MVLAAARSADAARTLRAAATAQREASLADPRRSTIRIDPAGDGQWVGRFGSRNADVIVVLVPGVGTDLGDRPSLTEDAERVWSRVTARAGAATSLGADAAQRIAVVSWLGYDPPDHVLAGVDGRPAGRGADRLAGDLADLRRRGATRIVAVGHSYGALVVAGAARRGAGLDELVVLGAPGVGVSAIEDLALRDGVDLWVARARRDPIVGVARIGFLHGADPERLGRSLPTSLPGHGSYLSDPELLDALAHVVLEEG